jgi:hypothetical protein
VSAVDDNRRNELVRELESLLADHIDDDGVVYRVESYVVLARTVG